MIWLMLILVAVMSFADGVTMPSRNALVPRLVGAEALLKVNGMLSTSDQVVQMAGWAIGGVIVAAIGTTMTLGITMGLFTIAVVLTLGVKEPISADGSSVTAKQNPSEMVKESTWHRIREGWLVMWNQPTLRTIAIMDMIEGMVGAAWIGAMLLVYVKENLHQTELWWGVLNALYFVGAIAGGLLVVGKSKLIERHPAGAIMLGSLMIAIFTLLFSFMTIPWIAVLITLIMGPAQQLRDITQRTIFQKSASPQMLPKVLSAHNTLSYALFGLSVMLLAYLSDHFGIRYVYIVTGIFYFITFILAAVYRARLNQVQSYLDNE
jgi:MFS family permease